MKSTPTKLAFLGVNDPQKIERYRDVFLSLKFYTVPSGLHQADLIIFFEQRFVDLLHRMLLKLRNRTGLHILVVQEPRVVLPTNYRWWVRGFDAIHYLGFSVVPISRKAHLGRWPNCDMSSFAKTPATGNGVVLINSNKVSAVPGGLYKLRLTCFKEIDQLELAGWGWRTPRLTKLPVALKTLALASLSLEKPQLGAVLRWVLASPLQVSEVEDKFKFLRKFGYALVIENSISYTSEKLFDALLAGVVPVYVGAPLPPVLKNLVVTAEPDVESIREALEEARGIDKQVWNRARIRFLQSQEAKLWDEEAVIQGIGRQIQAMDRS